MIELFYLCGAISVFATLRAITQLNAVRALLYLIVSFLGVAVIFYLLGAPFSAALEVITYAGAIMVLFVFVIMILNLGPPAEKQEKRWLTRGIWIEPALLACVLLAELVLATRAQAVSATTGGLTTIRVVGPREVGLALLGPYAIGVELASTLLLCGLVGAYHLGLQRKAAESSETAKEQAGHATPREVA